MPEEKQPAWLADQQSKEEWMQTRRSLRAVEVAERRPSSDEMPSWLAEVQPKKKEWSPVQDRIDAHFAGVRELSERQGRRRERLLRPMRKMVDWTAALVEARNELRAQAIEAKATAAAPVLEPPPAPAGPKPAAKPAAPPPPRQDPRYAPPAWADVAPRREAPAEPQAQPPTQPHTPPVQTPKVVRAMPPTAAPAPPPPPPPAPPVHKTPKVVRALPKPAPPQPSPPVPPPVRAAPPPPPPPPPPPAAPPAPAAPPPAMPPPVAEPPPMPAMPAMPAEPSPPAVLEPAALEEAPVEVAPPQSEPEPERKPKAKKEKKPRSNPLGAIVVQAKLIQQRREEQRQAERSQIIYAIRRMNDEAYETMLLDFFRRDGYTVYRVDDPASSEADLELHRNNERTLVGIKRRGHQVGQESVRELDKEIATSGANSAFLFTDGSFTEAAVRVANNSGVTLVDGNMLAELIEELTMSELRERKATSRLAKAIGWNKKAS